MKTFNHTNKYCVIGAGASGLAVAKNFNEHGIDFEVLERGNEVGGIWNYDREDSPIYRSTQLISSKPLTQYSDFPMPDEYPDYPNHRQALDYLKSYAGHFDLRSLIRFNTKVVQVDRAGDNWDVHLENGQIHRYRGLILATGFYWAPQWPEIKGEFKGEQIHSASYRTPDIAKEKRVLIVGAGNSGCDIAVEVSQNAEKTFHSVRRGYYYLPKYLFGKPTDQIGELFLEWHVPLFLRRWLSAFFLNTCVGRPECFGLPKPDHKLLETHPIINAQIFHVLGKGDLVPKPDIAELKGEKVLFKDGSQEEVDLIICATGYHVRFPYMKDEDLEWDGKFPRFYLNLFHPRYDNVMVVGLLHPDSGVWWLSDYQSRVLAKFFRAKEKGSRAAQWLSRKKRGKNPDLGGGVKYVNSDRHHYEVDHFTYAKRMRKLIKKLS